MSARPLRLSKPERGAQMTSVISPLLGRLPAPRPSPTPAVRLEARTRAFGMRAPPACAATTPAPAGPYEIGPQAFGTPSPPLEVPPPPAAPFESRTPVFWMTRLGTPARPFDVPPPAPFESRTLAFGMKCSARPTIPRTPRSPNAGVRDEVPARPHLDHPPRLPRLSNPERAFGMRSPPAGTSTPRALGPRKPDRRRFSTPALLLDVPRARCAP
ncbi:hypothetical protein B0H13DRAFT_2382380 [Mycena leptocephala]|nr:hypothetical protein B0H13DRAFT_2382380 [Mycena leptocephala]